MVEDKIIKIILEGKSKLIFRQFLGRGNVCLNFEFQVDVPRLKGDF
jgi:hypothetical protein